VGSGWRREVLVELEQVVGGRQEPPFGPDGGSPAPGEAGEAAVVLGIAEYRLDQLARCL